MLYQHINITKMLTFLHNDLQLYNSGKGLGTWCITWWTLFIVLLFNAGISGALHDVLESKIK